MERFVDMFAALGQAARLAIFRVLVSAGPDGCCVDDIRQRLHMAGSTLSHHLDTLTRCGLIAPRRDGRFIYYAVDWPRTTELIRFLTEDCCADLHRRVRPASGGNPSQGPVPASRRAASSSRRSTRR